ncbi:3-deoxy-manno-octulosonate cytidylyltransferase [candidate division GN15 bacterium]|nr:3-deoxy-manno-octulosonate cytidylyltransferase [candidate division GN15 bacterium]
MKPGVLAVIPARLGSSRFPGKALHSYRKRPLLYYVWHEMSRCKLVDRLVIATDSDVIADVAEGFGAEVARTSKAHKTGSDRAAEVALKIGGKIVVNIQGDNLGLKAGPVDRLVQTLQEQQSWDCGTLVKPIDKDDDLSDPNVVKVVWAPDGRALWFSRYPIPYLQQTKGGPHSRQFPYWGHIGVYAFRRRTLVDFAQAKQTLLERAESLEQLRLLELGKRMIVLKTKARTISVDTPEDVAKLARILK